MTQPPAHCRGGSGVSLWHKTKALGSQGPRSLASLMPACVPLVPPDIFQSIRHLGTWVPKLSIQSPTSCSPLVYSLSDCKSTIYLIHSRSPPACPGLEKLVHCDPWQESLQPRRWAATGNLILHRLFTDDVPGSSWEFLLLLHQKKPDSLHFTPTSKMFLASRQKSKYLFSLEENKVFLIQSFKTRNSTNIHRLSLYARPMLCARTSLSHYSILQEKPWNCRFTGNKTKNPTS